jgi:hypothetical protein
VYPHNIYGVGFVFTGIESPAFMRCGSPPAEFLRRSETSVLKWHHRFQTDDKMRFHAAKTKPNLGRAAAHRRWQNVGVEYDMDHRGLYGESTWRHPATVDQWPLEGDVLVSRWVDRRSFCRCEKTVSPSDRHVIGVALRTTRLKFTRGPRIIFDGLMPAGTNRSLAHLSHWLPSFIRLATSFISTYRTIISASAKMLRALGQLSRRLI